MKIKQFVETYQAFENMQTLDIVLPVSKKEMPDDKVVRIGMRGVLPTSLAYDGWNEIISYQRLQLKLYWKNFWQEMLESNSIEDTDCLYDFLRHNPDLISFMEEDWIFFIKTLYEKTYGRRNSEIEELLKSIYSEENLLKYRYNTRCQEALAQLMVSKVVHFNETLSFSVNYGIFINWLAARKDCYPMVWSAVADKLKEMKDNGEINLHCYEERRLYNLYCLPE